MEKTIENYSVPISILLLSGLGYDCQGPAKVQSATFYRFFDRPKGTAWEAIVFSFRVLIFFLISKRNGENDQKLSSLSINPFAVRS